MKSGNSMDEAPALSRFTANVSNCPKIWVAIMRMVLLLAGGWLRPLAHKLSVYK
jgi:hypothetical protein